MFNKLILLVLNVLLSLFLAAQVSQSWKKEDYDVHKFKVNNISIPLPQTNVPTKNIGAITVVDARPDTMHIGFMQKKALSNRIFLSLNQGAKNEIEVFVNKYLGLTSKDSSRRIIMLLKKCWLTDELDLDSSKYLGDNIKYRNEWTSGIVMKIEFYVNSQSDYYPLYRYDTVLSKALTIGEYGPEFIQLGLIASLSRLIKLDDQIPSIHGRKLSWDEIASYNEQHFNIPVLKDTSLNAGIYATFEEFKNNRPSQKDFEIRKEKLNDIIYIKQQDGTKIPVRNVWGYCDGKDIFIKSAENYFHLQKMGNAFYIYGAKNLNTVNNRATVPIGDYGPYQNYSTASIGSSATGAAVVDQFKHKNYKLTLKPFQLDWDSGKLY